MRAIDFDDLGLIERGDPRVELVIDLLIRRIYREQEVADVLGLARLIPGQYQLSVASNAWPDAVVDAARQRKLNDLINAATVKAPSFREELTDRLAGVDARPSRQAAIVDGRSATPVSDWRAELDETLAGSEFSRSPIVVAIETTSDRLSKKDLAPVERHLTVTLDDAEVDRLVRMARQAIVAPDSVATLIRSGRRVWESLETAKPRLASLADSVASVGFAQPLAWCGHARLLEQIHLPLLLAHLGTGELDGFMSIGRGSHYFNPVGPAKRQAMRRRLGKSSPRSRVVDLRSAPGEDELKLLATAASGEVLIAVDSSDRAIQPNQLVGTIAANAVSPTRAALVFSDRLPSSEELDALLAVVPFASFAPRGLADVDLLGAVEDAISERGTTWSLPSIVSMVRAAALRRAVAQRNMSACVQALRWSNWAWVGLPLFADEFGELVPAAFPHLMNLRSISGGWYFPRHAGIANEYQSHVLARSEPASDKRFHLYLSGAGGTGKSCFLRDVYQQARQRSTTVAVWYRVDAPNSRWESVESRVREETIEAVRERFGNEVANRLPSDTSRLAPFLSQTADTLRRATDDNGFTELLIFIDQLERTFEWGVEPDTARLRMISTSLMALLDEFRDDPTVRVFIASRKQYLPDFLESSRRADDVRLQFNVLQSISEQNEQREFVRTIVDWSVRSGLVAPELSIDPEAATMLGDKVGGEPLSMALALMELLSSAELGGNVSPRQLDQLEPWKRLFALDLESAAGDDLDWYFLLAMAHARAEIVSLDEVLWRLRMVHSGLTRQVDDLGRRGILERLWLLGFLGRTIHARPQRGRSAELVEFFHANFRDYLLRDVMSHGGSDLDLHDRRGGTPPAWRALDQLTIFAHDWEQMQQLLSPEDTSALMEHRLVVTGQYRRTGAEDGSSPTESAPEGLQRLELLFQREPDDARMRLSNAGTECLIFSALVHDQQGRRLFEELITDVSSRASLCQLWLARCAPMNRRPIMRYFVELLNEEARRMLIDMVLKEESPKREELGQILAEILAEPLYAARYRLEIIALLLISALQGRSDPATLPRYAVSIVVASCRNERETLMTLLGDCVERYLGSDRASVRALASRMDPRGLADSWLGAAGDLEPSLAIIDARPAIASFSLGLAMGDRVRAAVTDDRLRDWWQEISERIGLPLPQPVVIRGEVGPAHRTGIGTDDQIDLVSTQGYLGSGMFVADRLAVLKREWEVLGQPVPPSTPESYLAVVDEDVLWLTSEQCASVSDKLGVRNFGDVLVDWMERHCRRFLADVLDEDLFAQITRQLRPRMITLARLSLPSRKVKPVLTDLVSEGVPIGSVQRVLDQLIELAPETLEPTMLVSKLRERYSPEICQSVSDEYGRASVILLDEVTEQSLADRVGADTLEPTHRAALAAGLRRESDRIRTDLDAPPPVVLTLPVVRPLLSLIMRDVDPRLPILSFSEAGEALSPVFGGVVDVPELRARS